MRQPVLLLLGIVIAGPTAAQGASVGAVRSPSDIANIRVTMADAPSRYLTSPEFLSQTVPDIRRKAEALVAARRIENAALRQRINTGLASIAVLQDRRSDAVRYIVEERQAQDKPQLRALGLLFQESAAAGLGAPPERRCAAAAQSVRDRLAGVQPDIVRDEVLARHSQVQTASAPYYASLLAGGPDLEVKSQGSVDLATALMMATLRMQIDALPPCRDELTAAYRAWIDSPASAATNIWRDRHPDPRLFANAAPVVVAVWDSGIATPLFPGQMAIDPAEPLDGKDNDGNGVIDDVHGPTFDGYMRPTSSPIARPSAALAPQLDFQAAMLKGQQDLNYGINSPEAAQLAIRAREADVAAQALDIDLWGELGSRNHGTATASMIARDASFVRLYNVKAFPLEYAPRIQRVAEPEFDRWFNEIPRLIDRMKGAGVRVVNMSWVWPVEYIINNLLVGGAENDPGRARLRAEAIHARMRPVLTAALASAPDVLFVAAAGNSNEGDGTFGALPQSIDAPNLLVVGATGQSGKPTTFTTFGPRVKIYAQGENVESLTVSGQLFRDRGTSLAAPLVTRAAAQLLAVNPRLKPAEVIETLLSTASVDEGGLRLLNSKAAVLQAQKKNN